MNFTTHAVGIVGVDAALVATRTNQPVELIQN